MPAAVEQLETRWMMSSAVVLNVPHYAFWYSCAPTAVGVVMGYWDMHGIDLIPGNASTMTRAVKNTIAGRAHIVSGEENRPRNPNDVKGRYFGGGDWHDSRSYPHHEEHPSSLADYLKTVDGVTSRRDLLPGTGAFLQAHGQKDWRLWSQPSGPFSFKEIKSSIDAGEPLLAIVDSDGNGTLDHATVIVGYSTARNRKKIAFYETARQKVGWHGFGPVRAGSLFGIEEIDHVVPPAAERKV